MKPTKPTTPADSGQPATSGVSGKSGDASRHSLGRWEARDFYLAEVVTGPVVVVTAPDFDAGPGKARIVAICGRSNDEALADISRADAELIALLPRLISTLRDLVARCDGDEGVRADGSNIQTMAAHAVLDAVDGL